MIMYGLSLGAPSPLSSGASTAGARPRVGHPLGAPSGITAPMVGAMGGQPAPTDLQCAEIPVGLCQCGCGQSAPLACETRRDRGWIKGQPTRFIVGHSARDNSRPLWLVEDRGHSTPCWIWQRAKNPQGYGYVQRDGYEGKAHRYVYERSCGPIPEGLVLDHLCRNPECVNPEHLEPVTTAENTRRGDSALLSADQVREIRTAPRGYGTGRALAERYGVSESQISQIRNGHIWIECAVGNCRSPQHNHRTGFCEAHHERFLDRVHEYTQDIGRGEL